MFKSSMPLDPPPFFPPHLLSYSSHHDRNGSRSVVLSRVLVTLKSYTLGRLNIKTRNLIGPSVGLVASVHSLIHTSETQTRLLKFFIYAFLYSSNSYY